MRRAAALLTVLGVAAACGGRSAATTTVLPRPHVAITAQSHHPRLGHTWSYQVRVTSPAGKPVACRIHLQFFFGGSPVGEVGVHVVKTGLWKETIPATGKNAFPPASVGQPLVLRATVTAKGYRTGIAGWQVSVVK
jgi:hypothetical protein